MAVQFPLTSPSHFTQLPGRANGRDGRSPSKSLPIVHAPFLPVLPPLAPRRVVSYPLAVQQAPYTALRAMLVYDDEPTPHEVTKRCRLRTQVGSTNRWRLPETLGSDLLGINQAIRAIRNNFSHTVDVQKKNLDSSAPVESIPTTPHESPKRRPETEGRGPRASLAPTVASTFAKSRSVAPLAIQPFLYKTSKQEFKIGRHGNKVGTGLADSAPADVLLESLEEVWELHRPFLQKSNVLSKLLRAADYDKDKREEAASVTSRSEFICLDGSNCVKLELSIHDPWITKKSFAIALSKLYEEDMCFSGSGTVDAAAVVGVLGASLALEFTELSQWCRDYMLEEIDSLSVCHFHQGAIRYRLVGVAMACERWMCLHLVPTLSRCVTLRHLQPSTLQMILKSAKLFVTTEWQVYKTVCIWLYLQLNPKADILPAWTTIVTFFSNYTGSGFNMPEPIKTARSAPKAAAPSKSPTSLFPPGISGHLGKTRANSVSLLETEEGQVYTPLFQAVRLHGVTNTANIQDVIQMHILPQRWLLQTLHSHYKALQGRSSPPLLFANPISDSIRIGFVVKNKMEIKENFLLHGFHFGIHLHSANNLSDDWSFTLERLKPTEMTLNAPPLANQTVSLQNDREVNFYVQVTMLEGKTPVIINTGFISHIFTLGDHTSRKKEVVMSKLKLPIYVMFAICLPP